MARNPSATACDLCGGLGTILDLTIRPAETIVCPSCDGAGFLPTHALPS